MDRSLSGIRLLFSSSVPEDLEQHFRAQDHYSLVTSLLNGLFRAGGVLVFGGHPSLTRYVHAIGKLGTGEIHLFQSESFRDRRPPELDDPAVFRDVEWIPDAGSIPASLFALRERMVGAANAAVFAGGHVRMFQGNIPGIWEEYQLFLDRNPDGPVYLVGMLGGATRDLIDRDAPEPNGLSPEERQIVHESEDIDLVVGLILADLKRPRTTEEAVSFTVPGALTNLSLERAIDWGTPTVRVRFVYTPGLRWPAIAGARLAGSWDEFGRPSPAWSITPMRSIMLPEACPGFEAELPFPADLVGQDYRWGVLVDGLAGTDHWGVPVAAPDDDRTLSFRLVPGADGETPRVEPYWLSQARRLGAAKVFPPGADRPAIRFGVWDPEALAVDVVFGRTTDPDRPTLSRSDEPRPIHRVLGGHVSDTGEGLDPDRPPIRLLRHDAGLWFSPPDDPRLLDFAGFDQAPYRFRVTRGDGKVVFTADPYSRAQLGAGRHVPAEPGYAGPALDLDPGVACSLVIDPDRIARTPPGAVWPIPDSDRQPAAHFWEAEFDPARPVPQRAADLVIVEADRQRLLGSGRSDDPEPDPTALLDHLAELGANALLLRVGSSPDLPLTVGAGPFGRDRLCHLARACHRRGIAVLLSFVRAGSDPESRRSLAPPSALQAAGDLSVGAALALLEECHVDGFLFEGAGAIRAGGPDGARFLRDWTRSVKLVRPASLLLAGNGRDDPGPEEALGFDAAWSTQFADALVGPGGPDSARLLVEAGHGDDRPLRLGAFAGVLASQPPGRCVAAPTALGEPGLLAKAVNGAPTVGATRHWAEKRARLVAGLTLLSAGIPAFPAGAEVADEATPDPRRERQGAGRSMFAFHRDLIRLRLREPALREGTLEVLHADDQNRVLAFRRRRGDRSIVVVASFANRPYADGYEVEHPALGDGMLLETLASDARGYGGDGVANPGPLIPCRGGRFRTVLPAAGLVVFECHG